MMSWRVTAATVLLLAGVSFIGASAELDHLGYALLGGLALLFVPALIVDEARRNRQ